MGGGKPEVRAAGGVLWRRAEHGIEVLLVHRPRYDDWSLPKGKLDDGESWREAAAREIEEETGFTGDLGDKVGTVRYRDARGRRKEVRYYAVEEPTGDFVPNDEVDRLLWLSPAEAERRATRPDDGDVIRDFVRDLRA